MGKNTETEKKGSRGDHRPNWARYGEYLYVPPQRWLHNLEVCSGRIMKVSFNILCCFGDDSFDEKWAFLGTTIPIPGLIVEPKKTPEILFSMEQWSFFTIPA